MCQCDDNSRADGGAFTSGLLERLRRQGNVWPLGGGEILLPRVLGFCRGVTRALEMLEQAVARHVGDGKRLFLLGQIIHNPWVNRYFAARGVTILSERQRGELSSHVTAGDCAVIPAFGVTLRIEQSLRAIGCEIVDTTCGDVRRLWRWAQREADSGRGVVIFGRFDHDETVVTKSRLADRGGKYLVLGDMAEVDVFCRMVAGGAGDEEFAAAFGPGKTNAGGLAPLLQLAQVSQTTMLYDDTMLVRRRITAAFEQRFGGAAAGALMFQPTVCRATQDRQAAAVELCQSRPDLVVVVGGFGSSNTRHLYELARASAAAVFIEDADAMLPDGSLRTLDAGGTPAVVRDWLPARRPLRLGVLAGASSPEIVVEQVLVKLAAMLSS